MDIYPLQFKKLWGGRRTRLVLFLVALVSAFAVLDIQNFVLPSSPLPPSLIEKEITVSGQDSSKSSIPGINSSGGDLGLGDGQDAGDEFEFEVRNGTVLKKTKDGYVPVVGDEDGGDDYVDLDEEKGSDDGEEFVFDIGDGTLLKKNKDGHITVERRDGLGSASNISTADSSLNPEVSSTNSTVGLQGNLSSGGTSIEKEKNVQKFQNSSSNSTFASITEEVKTTNENKTKKMKKKKMMKNKAKVLGVLSISDMDRVLAESRASSESTVPQWNSKVDRQMLYAKMQIENAPKLTTDPELYGPVFRNLSMFKRSYELMEQMMKVYVYKEGDRPIFHKPFLTGIYASEGWFMKQMEENKHFVTDDPTKAHLFYIPFSSRILQEVLYVRDSHSHKPLVAHLNKYISLISSRYPFWNRTEGTDHFMAGCHDWATHETGESMGSVIRALCNADVREGFEIGKDVSLPETYVAVKNDPHRDLGGKPAHMRTLLAFFAGQMHGYLRPILLQNWENKEPDMIISGPMPHRIKKITTTRKKKKKKVTTNIYPYKNYMKDSKYCICPRGYEVNSPRVVEAIFYGCVPVLISDNFVPPFFEVLDWSAFSVILPEKDVPRLKEVLVGIPRRRFMKLERGVREVRRHFLWNNSPLKYDLFHMILHNIWFNRIYQFK